MPENEVAEKGKLGPGPAKYETHLNEKIRFGEANKFSIPRVSNLNIHNLLTFLVFSLGNTKNKLDGLEQKSK